MTRTLALHEWGPADADRVVCLHGITGWGGHFAGLAEDRLARRQRVLAVDLLGHGASPRKPPWSIEAQLDAVLATVGERPAIWLGHSFGGRLALELAASRPDLVDALVLLDPAIWVPPGMALLGAEAERHDRSYASVGEAIEQRFVESELRRASRDLVAAELRQQLDRGADGRWRYRYVQAAVVTAYGEMARRPPVFADTRAPTLVVVGADSYVPYAPFAEDHRAALGDRLDVVTVPGGHTLLWDAPEETGGAVMRFLDRHSANGA
jgi:lipase